MIAVLVAVSLPILIWVALMCIAPHGTARWEMDWSTTPGSFAYLQSYYTYSFSVIFWSGISLSLYIATIYRQEPAGILALSALYALAFNLWVTYCYEGYLHSKYPKIPPPPPPSQVDGCSVRYITESTYIGPSNYTATKYAATLSLAFSSVILFIIGVLMAVNLIVTR